MTISRTKIWSLYKKKTKKFAVVTVVWKIEKAESITVTRINNT